MLAHFAKNLRKYRVLKNLTQENLAGFFRITP